MNTLLLIACIGLVTGCFSLFGISPVGFTDGLFGFLVKKKGSIRSEIKEKTKRNKISFLRREITEIQEILTLTGRSNQFSIVCAASLLCFAAGAGTAILIGNMFLVPVLAVGMMFLPFWYIRLTANHFKKHTAAELETALSIITTAYLRSDDILSAVEESIDYLNPPVKSVFDGFLSRINLIDPDIDAALKAMIPKIQNDVFHEWCEAVADCQFDRNLKTTLIPVVAKLSEMRIVNAELEYLVYEPRKEFIMMAILVIGNIPIMYFLNKAWYHTLMHTAIGQLILAICGAAIFVSMAFVVRLTKPIEYRR